MTTTQTTVLSSSCFGKRTSPNFPQLLVSHSKSYHSCPQFSSLPMTAPLTLGLSITPTTNGHLKTTQPEKKVAMTVPLTPSKSRLLRLSPTGKITFGIIATTIERPAGDRFAATYIY